MRPRALDLFCKAGGMAAGLHRAGFDVVGVDHEPQPNYPYEFIQMDAFDALDALYARGINAPMGLAGSQHYVLGDFALIHASPPCQGYSTLRHRTGLEYPLWIGALRDALSYSGAPYVIENVQGAPLRNPVMLCGTMFPGLRVIRHRLFESNVPLMAPPHGKHPLVYTRDKRKAHYGKLDQDTSFVQVTGGGNCSVANAGEAMEIDWMTKAELNEAIPPAYGEFIGRQILEQLERVA